MGNAKPKSAWRGKLAELFSADLRSLAVLRIGLALIVICDVFLRARDLEAHYTDAGVMPRGGYLERLASKWALSLHFVSGQWQVQAILFALTAVIALCMLIGWRTRLATFATFVMVCSVQGRNPLLLQGGDILLRVTLFWCIFLPLGARASVDRVLAGQPEPAPTRSLSIATVALLLQLCIVYWFTAILKDGAAWRSEGTAIYYALSIDHYAMPLGRWLLSHPSLMTVLTYGVFWFEVLGPCFLLSPLWTGPVRTLAVGGFVALHFGVFFCIDLGLFPFISSITMLAFLPPWFWDRLVVRATWLTTRVDRAGRWATGVIQRRLGKLRGAPPESPLSRPAQVFVGLCLAYIIGWNLATVPGFPYDVGPDARVAGLVLRIEQRWDMFAPAPMRNDGWLVVPGKLVNGREVDLFRGGREVSWQSPSVRRQKNQRWRKYFMNISMASQRGHRLLYGRWLCRSWNAKHRGDERLETLEIVYMRERTMPYGQPPEEKRISLWKHRCFAAATPTPTQTPRIGPGGP